MRIEEEIEEEDRERIGEERIKKRRWIREEVGGEERIKEEKRRDRREKVGREDR
jgi:hypothetical protein